MAFAFNRVLAQSHLSKQTNAVKINASYDPSGGVKGGLKFCSIVNGGTGIYYVQLKNIFRRKDGITSINDGDTSFKMTNVVHFQAQVAGQTTVSIANSNFNTAFYHDTFNNLFIVYVYNASGLVNVPNNSRLNVEITYKKFEGAR